jgi:hypothetical protein
VSTGQASAEYTAVLALVTAALAGAGAAVGLGEVGRSVVHTVRTGICIVGGDICRPSDAEAAGLSPCTVTQETEGGATRLIVLSVRFGASGRWTLAERSDGSYVITRTDGTSLGAGVGLGLTASPFELKLGVKGAYDLAVATGSAWELPDAAALQRFLAADEDDRPPATWRSGDLGGELTAKAGAMVGGAMLTGVEASATAAAGARIGRDETTLYMRAALRGPALTAWLPGGGERLSARGTGDVMVELTRSGGDLREIAFRTVTEERPGRLVETVARLDLRDPGNRAAAAPLLGVRLPWPPRLVSDLRAVARRAVQTGTVERAVYERRDESDRFEVAAKLGLELGLQTDRIREQRRLVAASAWTGGSGERERTDCIATFVADRSPP